MRLFSPRSGARVPRNRKRSLGFDFEPLEQRLVLDTAGPRIVSMTPSGVVGGPVNAATVIFNETINAATFTAADVTVRNAAGYSVGLLGNPVPAGDGFTFTLNFASPLALPGLSRVDVGPAVNDLAGNPMNTDSDATNGEPEDAFQGSFQIAPGAAQAVPYSQDFETGTVALAGWSYSMTGFGTAQVVNTDSPHGGAYHIRLGQQYNGASSASATLRVDLSAYVGATDLSLGFWVFSEADSMTLSLSADGVNFSSPLSVNPLGGPYTHAGIDLDQALATAGIAPSSNIFIRWTASDSLTSEAAYLDDIVIGTGDVLGPRIVSAGFPNPSSGPFSSVSVTFNEAVDPSSFTAAQVAVQSPVGGYLPLASNPIPSPDLKTYTITLASPATAPGVYQLSIEPTVRDLAGNSLNQDNDLLDGETASSGNDRYLAYFSGNLSPNPTAPASQGFEAGAITGMPGWSFLTAGSGTLAVTPAGNPRGGYHLEFGQSTTTESRTAIAYWTLDLSGQAGATDLVLDFWAQQRNSTSSNSLQVQYSGDGVTWYTFVSTLFTVNPGQLDEYLYYGFDLDQALASRSIALDGDVYLRFIKSTAATNDGRMFLDDVRVFRSGAGFNLPPTITVATGLSLPSGNEDQTVTISFSQLNNLFPRSDPNGDATTYRIGPVLLGTLTKNGVPVVPYVTTVGTGESVVWTPPTNLNGTSIAAFKAQAWDGLLASSYVDVNCRVTPVNDAPVLNPAAVSNLPQINQGATNPAGISLIALAGAAVTDIDSSVIVFRGLAVTGLTETSNGTWQYKSSSNGTWTSIGAVSPASARLLSDAAYVRFVPSAPFVGQASITYKAWDASSGTAGSFGDTTFPGVSGGAGAFSLASATSTVLVVPLSNSPPTANAGGPYTVAEGGGVTLNASLSVDPDGHTLYYSWDVNNDGIYGELSGVSPTLSWTQLQALGIGDGPSTRQVRVSVTDLFSPPVISGPVTLTMNNTPPTVGISGWNVLVRGQTRSYFFLPQDPSPVDGGASFTIVIDWDGDGTADQAVASGAAGVTLDRVYASSGNCTIKATAIDKDGATGPIATLPVTVTNWAVLPDDSLPGVTNLVWGGTNGFDAYGFLPGLVLIQAENNVFFASPQAQFTPAYNGKVIVYAQGSSDLVFADVMSAPLVLYGGDEDDVLIGGRGSDRIEGGNGNDILFGGTLETDGNDTLLGGAGDDLLVGHLGADLLQGGTGQDLAIAGRLLFADLPGSVFGIQAEWTSGRPYAERVANLLGTGTGERNNGDIFLVPGSTVLDDGAVDQVLGEADDDWLVYDFSEDVAPDLAIGVEIATDIGP